MSEVGLKNWLRRWRWRLRYDALTFFNYFRGLRKIRLPEDLAAQNEDDSELIWAKPLGSQLYRLENVPYVEHINLHDVVRCHDRRDDFPLVTEIVSRSGNQTLRVEFTEETRADDAVDVIMELKARKVFYERAGHRRYMFNVEPTTDYESIANYLRSKEEDGLLWLYE